MRILLAPDGSRGDVQPMLALGAELVRRGNEIRLLAPRRFEADAGALGLEFRATSRDFEADGRARAGDFDAGPLRAMRALNDMFRQALAAQMVDVCEAASGVECVVAAGAQMAATTAAELHGGIALFVSYCPAMFPTPEMPPLWLPVGRMPRLANRAAWRLVTWGYNRMLRDRLDAERAARGLAPAGEIFRHFRGHGGILACDPELGPAPMEGPYRAPDQPGYLLPEQDSPLPEPVERFLAGGEPPVYIGFGSMMDPAPARTGQLLVEAARRVGCRAIIGRGWAGLDGDGGDEVLFVDDVPHRRLFPRVIAAVHHGGAGTTATVARAGIPQLVVPHLMDQYYWGHRIRCTGLGPPMLPRTRLSARALAARLRRLVADAGLRERAAEVARSLAARDPAARAADIIEARTGAHVSGARRGPRSEMV